MEKAGAVLLQGRPLGELLAAYPYSTSLNWRVADLPGGQRLIEASCVLDQARLLADQSAQGIITARESKLNLERVDRLELLATVLADQRGNMALHGLHLYFHCGNGKFKTVVLPSSALDALVLGRTLPRVVPGYGEEDFLPCAQD
jgi:hypothetical protein